MLKNTADIPGSWKHLIFYIRSYTMSDRRLYRDYTRFDMYTEYR